MEAAGGRRVDLFGMGVSVLVGDAVRFGGAAARAPAGEVVMATANGIPRGRDAGLIGGDYLEANSFGEDFDWILAFFFFRRRRRRWLRSLSW